MRRLVRSLVFLWPVLNWQGAQAQTPPPNPDEATIQQAAVDFVDAYNAKDASRLTALFGPQARVESAEGAVIEGAEAIKAGFESAFAAEPEAQISLTMDSLVFLTPDVAVEQGATEFFPDGELLTSRSKYLVVHLKKDGQWRMISARSMGEETVSNYEFLRRVRWLVGEWVDEDPSSVVESTVRWDEGKNFLIQDFSVRRGRETVQKGTHRIGWDAQARRIRGWVFDSQGGFGETSWEEVDGAWIVKSTGVGPDGVTRSGTRVMTPGGDRIDVRLTDRIAEGQRLPDIEFTMVRKPPKPVAASSAKPAAEGVK